MQFDDVFGGEQPKATPEVNFADFLHLFPVITLPLNLSSDIARLLAAERDPLDEAWAVRFLLREGEWFDDYTEYMPCFQLPNTGHFYALIYWQADLLGSAFHLITFEKTGEVIDRAVLAATRYDENEVVQTVCTIQPNHSISQVQGRIDAHTGRRLALNREDVATLQITTEGDIVEI